MHPTVSEHPPVTCGRRTAGLFVVIAVTMVVGGGQTASAATPSGKKITRTARALTEKYPVRATLFGVWKDGRRLASGAFGESRPGVPATRADHFRIGNTGESIIVTLLLQLVDDGRLSLDDPLSNWLPNLPGAQQVTLGMLARSTSGYADFVTNPEFEDAFNAASPSTARRSSHRERAGRSPTPTSCSWERSCDAPPEGPSTGCCASGSGASSA